MMKGQELKILFYQDTAYLTSYKPLTFKQVQLPEYAQTKGFKQPAYWTVRVINHIESKKKLFCDVISYHVGETELNYTQQVLDKIDNIEIVTFRDIDTRGLFKTLFGGTSPSSYVPSKSVSVDKPKHHHQFETAVRQPYKLTFKETFYVPIKNVHFILGGVSFEMWLQEPNKRVEFTIPNEDIREEFDAVKNYFANVLGTKKIQVNVTIELSDDKVTALSAESAEINKINKELIEKVRFELLKTIKKVNVNSDKNILTIEECFENLNDKQLNPTTFYNDDKDFIDDLLKLSGTRHYKHLRYLSSKHAHNTMKLRYVRNPFSFIFLLERNMDNYLVWETLDTEEATYIWKIGKDTNAIKSELERLESIVNKIKVEGKKAYLDTAKEELIRIFHDYSVDGDGFVTWKEKLERILI